MWYLYTDRDNATFLPFFFTSFGPFLTLSIYIFFYSFLFCSFGVIRYAFVPRPCPVLSPARTGS